MAVRSEPVSIEEEIARLETESAELTATIESFTRMEGRAIREVQRDQLRLQNEIKRQELDLIKLEKERTELAELRITRELNARKAAIESLKTASADFNTMYGDKTGGKTTIAQAKEAQY